MKVGREVILDSLPPPPHPTLSAMIIPRPDPPLTVFLSRTTLTFNNTFSGLGFLNSYIYRYEMPKNFKCEYNHKICTDIALRFVQDHRRLPVLHMTSAAFHTKLG